jgi:hypothetical protein
VSGATQTGLPVVTCATCSPIGIARCRGVLDRT